MNYTYKIFTYFLISLLSLSAGFSQTQYWDKFFNKKRNKKQAFYYSKDQVKEKVRHIDYYQISTDQKIKTIRMSYGRNRSILGKDIYSYWDNGKLKAHHILNITSGKPRKIPSSFSKKADMSPKFQYTIEFTYYYSNGNKKYHRTYSSETKKSSSTYWEPNGEERLATDHFPGISESLMVNEEPKPINIEKIKRSVSYPVIARNRGIQGQVNMRVLVNEEGEIIEYKIINQVHPFLASDVEAYILDLTFTPALIDGKPIMFWVNIPFNFTIMN